MSHQQTDADRGVFTLSLVECDDRQGIYETWVGNHETGHGFHRYELVTGDCVRLDVAHPGESELALARRVGDSIARALHTTGELPHRLEGQS